jgi:hypothetical protein
MHSNRVFRYRPVCSVSGCGEPASFKIGASWSDGASRELKNYGLACDHHRELVLEAARLRRDQLRHADGETIGPVELFALMPDTRDLELPRLEVRTRATGH